MSNKKLEELTNDELLQEAKNMKPTKMYDAVIFGLLVGIAIYSTVKNGLGLLTFLHIFYLPIARKNNEKRKALDNLLNERNLK